MSNESQGPWKGIAIAASAAIVVAMVVALASNGCGKRDAGNGNAPAATAPKPVTHLRVGIGAEPKTIDSTKSYESAGIEVVMNYCEPLVWYDQATFAPIPGAAERWDVSPDGTTYTFHLRANATWWGGRLTAPEPVTAGDFVAAWQRLLDPRTAAQYIELPLHMGITGTTAYFAKLKAIQPIAEQLAAAEKDGNAAQVAALTPQVEQAYASLEQPRVGLGFRAVDDHTFEVQLDDAARGKILMKLAGFPILCPVHQPTLDRCEPRDAQGKALPKVCTWTDPEHIVVNGPYLISEHVLNSHFTLVKNPRYWNAANVAIDRATLFTVTDEVGMIRKYESRDLDDALDWLGVPIPPDRIDQWKSHPDYRTTTLYGTYSYWFNTRKRPLDNVDVRRALCYAIDRQSIVTNVTRGGQVPLHGAFPPLKGEYEPIPVAQGIIFDPARARQFLAAAGFPGGRGLPSLTLKYNTNVGHKAVAEAIQAMWRQHLGVVVAIQNQDWASFVADRLNGNFQIARAGWQGDFLHTHTFASLFPSNSTFNDAKWSDPSRQLDGLVDRALATADPAAAQQLYQTIERILVSGVPACPIYVYTKPDLVKPWVKGYHPNAKNYHPIHQLRIEIKR